LYLTDALICRVVYFFCYSSSGDYRDLHSFPTRRSSDLAVVEVDVERIQTSCGYSIPFMDYRDERPTLQQWAERKGDDGLQAYWADRKSTRLNSSHVKISYAVFCLKKKK